MPRHEDVEIGHTLNLSESNPPRPERSRHNEEGAVPTHPHEKDPANDQIKAEGTHHKRDFESRSIRVSPNCHGREYHERPEREQNHHTSQPMRAQPIGALRSLDIMGTEIPAGMLIYHDALPTKRFSRAVRQQALRREPSLR